jgi:hypothetical protein
MASLTRMILDYPYLLTVLIFLSLLLTGMHFLPAQRRSILLSAGLGAPCSLLALFVVPEYWKPKLIVALPVGLEDFLFSFVTGGISWLLFCAFRRISPEECANASPRAGRYVSCILSGALFFEGMRMAGFGYTGSIWISMYLFGGLFLFLKRPYGRAALGSSIAFAAVYALLLKGAIILWPETLGYWGADAAARQICGLPWMEIAWALGYGFTWPLFMAWVFDLDPEGLPTESKAYG